MIFQEVAESLNRCIENCKKKEYIVFDNTEMTNGRFNRYYFTKNQLLEYIEKHELCKLKVFRIKDEVKIKKEITIEEKEDD
jgi:hypothetical protein